MKTKIFFVLLCFFSGTIFCNSIFAATELWSYDGWESVRQVILDGKGGCAFIRMETNDIAEVVWLDKKGQLVYKTNINVTNSTGFFPVKILFFKKKSLFFSDFRNTLSSVIEVNNKGQETTIQSTGNNVGGPMLMIYDQSNLSDKRGFFTIKFDVVNSRQSIVRFNNK